MKIDYLEMHGTGNRILVVDQRRTGLPPPDAARVRELGAGLAGPGFDQMLWVAKATGPDFAASYRVFNADGSEVGQCGNGVRCVARMIAARGDARNFTLQSPTGPVDARINPDGSVSVSMGRPEFEPARIPFVARSKADRYRLEVGGRELDVAVVSMGNPHCVLEVDDVTAAPVDTLGPVIERHARFPERTNVGFRRVIDRAHIELRVFERGVGETLACGTGACAAVVTGQRAGLLDAEVLAGLPGGEVMVSWRGDDEPVWLTGNAEVVSEGSIDL